MRIAKIDQRYSVREDGVVLSGGLPLAVVRGGVNIHGRRIKVAFLVARAFVPNSELRPWVRHLNGDLEDNRAENLEWCEEKEERRRGRKPAQRWVRAWTLEGETAGCWRNVQEAADDVGVSPAAIRACLRGERRMAGGLLWR